VFLYAFDLIELDGKDLRRIAVELRKATLAKILHKAKPGLKLNEHLTDPGHIANTFIVVAASPPTAGRAGQDRVKMQDGATEVDFDDCAKTLFDRWTSSARTLGLNTDA
jgi:hypothetical protein